ncbi:uncharacterized protein LOC113279033 [Papaver somniferum]|uniref:uncharacterized protein LOC113279033 n=1 Tax=Papaver somniferum TaxID=3469 RepID=UPI000E703A62|nr:uncharacterized protein LOC113279033 [Papaver somniferum]
MESVEKFLDIPGNRETLHELFREEYPARGYLDSSSQAFNQSYVVLGPVNSETHRIIKSMEPIENGMDLEPIIPLVPAGILKEYPNTHIINPIGLAGGLALSWVDGIYFEIIQWNTNMINILVQTNSETKKWLLTCFYGSPYPTNRKIAWDFISDIASQVEMNSMPWVLLGDLNMIFSQEDKCGGLPYDKADSKYCQNILRDAVAAGSDHCPISLNLDTKFSKIVHTFKYYDTWEKEPSCVQTIQKTWNQSGSDSPSELLIQNLKSLQSMLDYWKKNIFGLPSKHIKKILAQIDNLESSSHIYKKEEKIKEKLGQLEQLYATHEAIAKQQSRDNLVQLGEKNTKFFHTKTLKRRKWNNIECIRKSNNKITFKRPEIHDTLTDYFTKLFSSPDSLPTPNPAIFGTIVPCISPPENDLLNSVPTREEIWKISDNIIIAQEIIHSFKKKKVKHAGMGIKIDMSKAFDRVDWDFLIKAMKAFGFDSKFYDCLLFIRVDLKECHNILKLIETFSTTSGQMINFEKSGVFFSKKVQPKHQTMICKILKIKKIDPKDTYLGTPLFISREKIQLFDSIVEKMKQKIQRWIGKTLSQASKMVLNKATLASVASYQMSCFILPKETTKKIDAL